MGKIDSFKVQSAPAAFAPTARALNALIDLIATMEGQNGVSVTVTEGKILFEVDPNTIGNRGGGGSALTQDQFNTMLLTALGAGAVKDAIFDIITDYIAANLPVQSLETCDGAINVLGPP